eukprot:4108583-Karenia_brevis.AAC.1
MRGVKPNPTVGTEVFHNACSPELLMRPGFHIISNAMLADDRTARQEVSVEVSAKDITQPGKFPTCLAKFLRQLAKDNPKLIIWQATRKMPIDNNSKPRCNNHHIVK